MPPLLRFDPSPALQVGDGLEPSELARLGPVLDRLRDEICDIDEKMLAGEIPTPPSKQPLNAAFASLPQWLLSEYEADRTASQLGRMLAVTKQIMTEVDRVVVLAEPGWLGAPRALMQACCQPHFNELTRGERGSRPRMVFVGDSFDNDAVQGVMQLLGAHRDRAAACLTERWALVVMGNACEPFGASRLLLPFMRALEVNCGGDGQLARSRAIVVAGEMSPLRQFARELGLAQEFFIPAAMGAAYSGLSLVGLLPAALLGINVMKLLEGAHAVHEHFRTTKAASNEVLQYAVVNHLFRQKLATRQRCWNLWSERLEAMAAWYQRLIRDSLGEALHVDVWPKFAKPIAARPELLQQIVVRQFRFDPLSLSGPRSQATETEEESLAQNATSFHSSRDLVGVLLDAIDHTQRSLVQAGRPISLLTLPRVDELCVGELLQWLMLATVVEARLLGRNPYQ
ncbi:MAG: hypothetical protein KDA51_14405 [Planctomycetales bacterium]|nr:hypothetical protein [Planctomycetales bacterium]MCA9182651.1 hypothetical protein [Planctomycetales bacterium]